MGRWAELTTPSMVCSALEEARELVSLSLRSLESSPKDTEPTNLSAKESPGGTPTLCSQRNQPLLTPLRPEQPQRGSLFLEAIDLQAPPCPAPGEELACLLGLKAEPGSRRKTFLTLPSAPGWSRPHREGLSSLSLEACKLMLSMHQGTSGSKHKSPRIL